MSRLKMTEGFDVALEMSGAPAAFDQLFDSVVTGGRVALLGLPAKPTLVDWNKVIFKQLTLKGIYGREMFETWHKMIAMLESGLERAQGHHPPPAGRASSWRASRPCAAATAARSCSTGPRHNPTKCESSAVREAPRRLEVTEGLAAWNS